MTRAPRRGRRRFGGVRGNSLSPRAVRVPFRAMPHPMLRRPLLVLGALVAPSIAQARCPDADGVPCAEGQCPAPAEVTVPSRRLPTLQAGLDAVADGGTVRIRAGRYVEALTITGKTVRVEGGGRGAEIVAPGGDRAVLTYGPGGGGTLSRLTLVGGAAGIATDDDALPAVGAERVRIEGGERGIAGRFGALDLERVEIEGTVGHGVVLRGVDRLRIRRTLVRDSGGIGLLIYAASQAPGGLRIDRATVTDHAAGGIHVVGDAVPVEITRSFVGGNGVAGVTFDNARGAVSGTDMAFNGFGPDGTFGNGLRVYRSAVGVDANRIVENGGAGLLVAGCDADGAPAAAALSDNTFAGNGLAIGVGAADCVPPSAADVSLSDDGGNRCLPCADKVCACRATTTGDLSPAPPTP